MKTLKKLLALAILFTASLALAAPQLPSKSTTRYYFLRYKVAAPTSNVSGDLVGLLPAPGLVLKDVMVAQTAAGTTGTSWTATPKRNGVAMVSTPGGWTLAAGTGKVTNVLYAPMGQLGVATGGTRPVIQKLVYASTTVQAGTVVAGDTVTIGGVVYTAAASGNGTSTFTTYGASTPTKTAAALAAAINANPASVVSVPTLPTTPTMTIVSKSMNAATGNAITATESADFTIGASPLTGGYQLEGAQGDIITMDVTLTGSYSPGPAGEVTLVFEPEM
jgi:hypothetical protein